MVDFLSSAACHGRRPRILASRSIVERPDVLSKLMDERQVARFLIAPPGYGKATVALEYAQTVFGFHHVFWIEGTGPCFLRDLDAGTMAEEVLKRDPQVALVVLSHVPAVGTQRADELSRCIDVWLAHDCEVLVSLTPGSDSFARRQPDRLCLTSEHLILPLPEGEVADENGPFDAARIPLLAWGSDGAMDDFVKGLAHEPLPHDLAYLFFAVMVLGRSDFETLQKLMRLSNLSALSSVLDYYPHLGHHPQSEAFSAMEIPIESLARAYKSRLPLLMDSANAEGVEEMLLQLAQALDDSGQKERACDLVRLTAAVDARRSWALAQGKSLIRALKPLALYRLIDKIRYNATPEGSHLTVMRSLCLVMLGRHREGSTAALRVLRADYTEPADRRMAAFVLLRWGDVEQRQRSQSLLAELDGELNAYESVQLALSREAFSALDVWRGFAYQDVPREELNFALVLVASSFPQEMALPLTEYLEQIGEPETLELVAYLAVKMCREHEELSQMGVFLPPALMIPFFDARTDLIRQQTEYASLFEKKKTWSSPATMPHLYQLPHEVEIDPLEVHMFGGLEVYVGGTLVDPRYFSRRQVRALMAILAINNGKEVSLDRLCSTLWPGSTRAAGRKNLYAMWSVLRRPFIRPDGSCPYFLHSRGGYRIDERLLDTDVKRVDAICDDFKFEEVDALMWSAHLKTLERISDGELLPGEDRNEIIVSAREEYRVKIVNALSTAAERLLESGESRIALLFAQGARKREQNREDVAYVLAAAQFACGRREDALNTYLANKRYLADVFGIDPSPRMVRLYRNIIEEEEDF